MKILIVGAGVNGLLSAHVLQQRGHRVTVVDRSEGPGRETSFANGALLTPSMPQPWNSPGCWKAIVGSLGRTDSPLQLRLKAVPSLLGWGIQFLQQSQRHHFERNTLSNLRLSLLSLKTMRSLRETVGVADEYVSTGTLRIFRDRGVLAQARADAQGLLSEGLKMDELSTSETIDLEPALAPIWGQLIGALYYRDDETSDAYKYCLALTEYLKGQGVDLRFGVTVTSMEVNAGRTVAARTDMGTLTADCYIVCAGSYSAPLLRRSGVGLPIRPVKGYSLTVQREKAGGALHVPIVDDDLHAVVVPLANSVRIAGTAEFAGYDLSLPAARVRSLTTLLGQILPDERFDASAGRPWCGLRAMSADGVPIVSQTPVENLFVSTGHGHLGWTMAAGSAQLLADLIECKIPQIDPKPYALERFTSARAKRPRVG